MTTVKEIEEAILHLPENELAELRAWFTRFDAKMWDQQFVEDAQGGRLDELANQALKDFDEGQCKTL